MSCELSKEQALAKAASLCSCREYCTSQMQERLLSWGISDRDTEDIICHLIKEKYIDPELIVTTSSATIIGAE